MGILKGIGVALVAIIVVLIGILAFLKILHSDSQEYGDIELTASQNDLQEYSDIELAAIIAVRGYRDVLKNPESLQLHHIQTYPFGDSYLIKMDVSAQNGFGGMNRNEMFVLIDSDSIADISVQFEDFSQKLQRDLWSDTAADKSDLDAKKILEAVLNEDVLTSQIKFPKSAVGVVAADNNESASVSTTNENENAVSQNTDKSTGFDYNYIFADSDSRYLTSSDLYYLDATQLRLARNEIYARHGYVFKSKDLQEYFSNQSWYVPLYDNDRIVLSKTEMANVELIKTYEQ
jgi:hypothetical protein